MNITLEAYTNQVIAFDFAHLQRYLSQLPDTRSNRGKVYPLSLILTYILMAKLAGCDKPSAIASWVRKRQVALLKWGDSDHQRTPCLNTYRTILAEVVDEARLAELFRNYLHDTYGGQESQLVVMDGKTMRGTIPKGETQGVHLLAVYLPEEGVVLGQVEVGAKENEISAAAGVLSTVPLKNRVVCADAMQTQRKLSVEILARGGDYLWTAKENQPTLRADIAQFFEPSRVAKGWHIPDLPCWTAETIEKGHGRIEVRRITVMQNVDGFLDWPGVQQLFKLVRQVTYQKSQKTTSEVVYGLTSCTRQRASAAQLLDWIRAYWGIENGLHYRRDKTLQEDATRFSLPKMPVVMATINNFVIGLTQKLGYANLPEARRVFDWSIACQLSR